MKNKKTGILYSKVTETQYKPAISVRTLPYLKKAYYNDSIIIATSKDTKGLIKKLDGSLKKVATYVGTFYQSLIYL